MNYFPIKLLCSHAQPSPALSCQAETNTLAAPPQTRSIQNTQEYGMSKHVNLLAVGRLVSPSLLSPHLSCLFRWREKDYWKIRGWECEPRWLQDCSVTLIALTVNVYLSFPAHSSTISSRFHAVWVVWFRGLICCLCSPSHWASASSCFGYWHTALSALTPALPGSLNCADCRM